MIRSNLSSTPSNREITTQRQPKRSGDMYDFSQLINDTVVDITDEAGSSTGMSVSMVKVDLNNLECSANHPHTTAALKNCQINLMRPVSFLLVLIGWKSLIRNVAAYRCRNICACFINVLYTIVVLMFLAFSYMYQYIACQWMVHPGHEQHFTTTTRHSNFSLLSDSENYSGFQTLMPFIPSTCTHAAYTYLIPSVLHFIAYIAGFIYFRVFYREEVYALMEKVFLYCSPINSQHNSQKKLIYRVRILLILGSLWVIFAFATNLLCATTASFWHEINHRFGLKSMSSFGYIIVCAAETGCFIQYIITMVIVYNYGIQCELIVLYTDVLKTKFQDKLMSLKDIMKDLYVCKKDITALNKTSAAMMSLLLIFSISSFLMGFRLLLSNDINTVLIWVYRTAFVLHLIPLFALSVIPAFRVNDNIQKFKSLAMEARIYGYKNTTQADLDSFVSFIININSFATRLLYIPVRRNHILVLICLSFIVFLSLGHTGLLD